MTRGTGISWCRLMTKTWSVWRRSGDNVIWRYVGLQSALQVLKQTCLELIEFLHLHPVDQQLIKFLIMRSDAYVRRYLCSRRRARLTFIPSCSTQPHLWIVICEFTHIPHRTILSSRKYWNKYITSIITIIPQFMEYKNIISSTT